MPQKAFNKLNMQKGQQNKKVNICAEFKRMEFVAIKSKNYYISLKLFLHFF